MRNAQGVFDFLVVTPFSWGSNWVWGMPLIVLTVVIHLAGLALVSERAVVAGFKMIERHRPKAVIVVMGATTLLATCLHAIEAGIWAFAYRFLGALPDLRSSMLYSLNAMTSYGHENLSLEVHWQLMGALEALNGWLLFGLTTAFLFAVIQKVWLSDSGGSRRPVSAVPANPEEDEFNPSRELRWHPRL